MVTPSGHVLLCSEHQTATGETSGTPRDLADDWNLVP